MDLSSYLSFQTSPLLIIHKSSPLRIRSLLPRSITTYEEIIETVSYRHQDSYQRRYGNKGTGKEIRSKGIRDKGIRERIPLGIDPEAPS